MEHHDDVDGRTLSCIGSDGAVYELIVAGANGEICFRLPDGSRAVRISKGAYKAVGRLLYLWCNDSDAP